MSKKLWSPELGGILPNWLTDDEKARCYCDDRGWVLVHLDGNEEVIVAGGRYNDPEEKGHGFDPVTGNSLDRDRDPAHGVAPLAPPPQVYNLGSSTSSFNEGSSVSVQLTTENVPDGPISYTISGIESEDLVSGSLSGQFDLVNGSAFINLELVEDQTTEGDQLITLTLDNGQASVNINAIDTSLNPPVYSLSSSLTEVNEGQDLTISLSTQNVSNGTDIAYTITGIQQADLSSGSLTGNFTVGSVESITLGIASDLSFEEGNETLTFTLDGLGESVDVTVNDTSVATPVYSLSAPLSVNEGDSLTISLSTQYVSAGTSIPYTITGIQQEDLFSGALTGNFVVGTTDSIILGISSDLSFEEGNETLTLTLDGLGESVDVNIVDSSVADPVYSLSSLASVDEGQDLTISLSTQYVSAGTSIPYTITGISQADLSAGYLTGNFVVGTVDSITLGIAEDASFEEGNETFTLTLDGLGESVDVNIVDTSIADPVYSLSAPTSVNEGQDLTISLSTQYVSAGTQVPYQITGISQADLSAGSLTGNFVVGTTDSITVTIAEDLSDNEGSETLRLTLLTGTGDFVDVLINDTSKAPVYNLSSSPIGDVDEGNTVVITLNAVNVEPNTTIGYNVTGISSADLDTGSAALSGGILLTGADSSSVSGSLTFNIKADVLTEPTPESLILTLDGNVASINVDINDTSQSVYILTATNTIDGAINEGEDLIINLSTVNVSGPVPYEVTGNYESNDFDAGGDPLSGNFTLDQNGNSFVTFKIKADEITDGPESLTLTLTGTSNQISITINDTSIEPSSEVGVITFKGGVPAISGDSTVISTNIWDGADSNSYYEGMTKGEVKIFDRNPANNTITEKYKIPRPGGAGSGSTDTTKFGRENVSLSNDGSIIAVSATGDGNGKVYIYEWDEVNSLYDIRNEIPAPESNNFGYCSLSGDGLTLIVGSSGLDKVYTYEYNTGTNQWNRNTSAEFTIPTNLNSVSISNTNKDVLIVGSAVADTVYTYDWNGSTWVHRSSSNLVLDALGYGDGDWGNTLSLSNDGNTLALSSGSSTYTWHVWDWDANSSQWVNRLVGDDNSAYGPLGNYIGASGVNSGIITLVVSYKRNANSEVRVINIPQNP